MIGKDYDKSNFIQNGKKIGIYPFFKKSSYMIMI